MKLFVVCFLSIALIFSIPNSSIAQKENTYNENLKEISVDETTSVKQFSDGRIQGIKNPKALSAMQKKKLLKLMRFTDEEIESYPTYFQDELLQDGGVKIDLETTELHIYTDSQMELIIL